MKKIISEDKHGWPIEEGFIDKVVPEGKCDCGANAVGSTRHSDWCSGVKQQTGIDALKPGDQIEVYDHKVMVPAEVVEPPYEHTDSEGPMWMVFFRFKGKADVPADLADEVWEAYWDGNRWVLNY